MDNNIDTRLDKILPVNLEDEMKKSYIDYAMSVIVSRALPDVRDGLKPVQRRILYAMSELNLDPTKGYKKSARIVGDTMGKYHPHGESSIYDAMVRMAQDFSMRYMLVDGHGNFGSMDGDSAAAQRYTESRLSRMAVEMLADIEKETVDFVPNYDGEFHEPSVLPARYPNLLVNGSSGIAVGMATNIPPHNLSEAIDAILCIIDNRTMRQRETDIEELLAIVRGPDFPTGATILGTAGIKQAYRTGRGKVIVRAVADIQPMGQGREMIVVTELPYQVNKARMQERIAELVKDKRIEGISDMRDESDRNGIRVVIELKKDANANVILNQLYKFSSLQESFGMNMLALVDNEAKVLNLKEMLELYLEHQKEVVSRRTLFELKKAKKRAHILEGLLIALDNIDEVIHLIRSSPDTATARARLTERFALTEEQSSAIVEMRLRSLTGLERGRLEQEYAELMALIEELTSILQDENRLYAVIREEILIIKTKYGDPRRSQIVHNPGEIDMEDLIDEENCVITMTHLDYIKRLPLTTYKSQNRGGKGIIGMQMRDEDLIKNLFVAGSHDFILFFTNRGRVYRIKAYEIPEAGRTARGLAIVNLLALSPGEKITAAFPVQDSNRASLQGAEEENVNDDYLVMITRKGIIKKTAMRLYANIKKAGLVALTIREEDELMAVLHTDGYRELFIATVNGMGIRFKEQEIRPLGRAAAGVKAIGLDGNDSVVGAGVIEPDNKLLLVSVNGYGKCTENDEFRVQHRAGRGLKIYRITPKTGNVLGVAAVNEKEELMLINSEGVIIRIRVADISTYGRYAQGVKLINLDEGTTVVSFAKIAEGDVAVGEELDAYDEQPDGDALDDGAGEGME